MVPLSCWVIWARQKMLWTWQNATAKTGEASTCFLYAGDACRVGGRLNEARDYYRKAIAAIKSGEADKPHRQRDRARAEASLAAIEFYTLDPKQVKDGTYTASSIGYEADVHVEVIVKEDGLKVFESLSTARNSLIVDHRYAA